MLSLLGIQQSRGRGRPSPDLILRLPISPDCPSPHLPTSPDSPDSPLFRHSCLLSALSIPHGVCYLAQCVSAPEESGVAIVRWLARRRPSPSLYRSFFLPFVQVAALREEPSFHHSRTPRRLICSPSPSRWCSWASILVYCLICLISSHAVT